MLSIICGCISSAGIRQSWGENLLESVSGNEGPVHVNDTYSLAGRYRWKDETDILKVKDGVELTNLYHRVHACVWRLWHSAATFSSFFFRKCPGLGLPLEYQVDHGLDVSWETRQLLWPKFFFSKDFVASNLCFLSARDYLWVYIFSRDPAVLGREFVGKCKWERRPGSCQWHVQSCW